MALKTDSQLLTESTVIKTETTTGANTATRVGTMFEDLINSKINSGSIDTGSALGTSNILVPSQAAVKTYVDGKIAAIISTGSITTSQGITGSLTVTGSLTTVGLFQSDNIVVDPSSNQIVAGAGGIGNVVLGFGNTGILSSYAIVGGQENPDQAANSVAVFGRQNQVGTGYATLVAGRANLANGNHSTVYGYGNITTGDSSHAEGVTTTATGIAAHSEGISTVAQGNYSHAEGETTRAIGASSHAEGYLATASADYSHAEGRATVAVGTFSHAEGIATQAQGTYSHAEGNTTIAIGSAAHSEGQNTVAYGNYSHAEGLGTIASGSNQTVVGKYNIRGNTTSLFVIGNGTGDANTARKDVVRVETAGVQITGSLIASGSTHTVSGSVNISGSLIINSQDITQPPIQSATVDLSSAQVLSLFTNPVTLIPAPGANKYISVVHTVIYYKYNGSVYTANPTVRVVNGTTVLQAFTALAQAQDMVFTAPGGTHTTIAGDSNSGLSAATLVNQAVTISGITGNPTGGNGTLRVRVLYTVENVL